MWKNYAKLQLKYRESGNLVYEENMKEYDGTCANYEGT